MMPLAFMSASATNPEDKKETLVLSKNLSEANPLFIKAIKGRIEFYEKNHSVHGKVYNAYLVSENGFKHGLGCIKKAFGDAPPTSWVKSYDMWYGVNNTPADIVYLFNELLQKQHVI